MIKINFLIAGRSDIHRQTEAQCPLNLSANAGCNFNCLPACANHFVWPYLDCLLCMQDQLRNWYRIETGTRSANTVRANTQTNIALSPNITNNADPTPLDNTAQPSESVVDVDQVYENLDEWEFLDYETQN